MALKWLARRVSPTLAFVEGRMGDRIAEIPSDAGRDPMPRAHLIAAAPTLLEAVKEALTWCKADAANEDGYPTQAMFEARVEVLRAAVKAADGRSKAPRRRSS